MFLICDRILCFPINFHEKVKLSTFNSVSFSSPSPKTETKHPHAQSWETVNTNGFKNSVFIFGSGNLKNFCNLWPYATTLFGDNLLLFPSEITQNISNSSGYFVPALFDPIRYAARCACPTLFPHELLKDFKRTLITDYLVTPGTVCFGKSKYGIKKKKDALQWLH